MGLQAVSPYVTEAINPAVGYHYFLPSLRLFSGRRGDKGQRPYVCKRNIVGLGYSTWVR